MTQKDLGKIGLCLWLLHSVVVCGWCATPRQVSAWRQDLNYLSREMPRRHKSFYDQISPAKFEKAVAALDRKIPSLGSDEFLVEIMKLVALAGPGNGHTYVLRTGDSTNPMLAPDANTVGSDENIRRMKLRQYPIAFYLFSDGLFVRSASSDYSQLIGGKVLRIGKRSADEAYALAKPLVARDNEMDVKAFVPRFLGVPEILDGLHITTDMDATPITVEKSGHVISATLRPQSYPVTGPLIDMADRDKTALYLQHLHDYFWSQYVPESELLYVQMNAVRDKNEQTLSDFFSQILKLAEEKPVKKFVLDLRFNPGGNTDLLQPIVPAIIRSDKINQRGRFYVIVGRETFSAAMNFSLLLEHLTNATFVGEPTGGSVGFYGDNLPIEFSNTKLQVRVSWVWWQYMDSRDTRPWIAPELAADLSSSQYVGNQDPALDVIVHHGGTVDYGQEIITAGKKNELEALRNAVNAYQRDALAKYQSMEDAINFAGYEFMQQRNFAAAIEAYKVGLRLYPGAWNLYDSLGEVLQNAGDVQGALTNYRRSLSLNPRNFNAEDHIRVLVKMKCRAESMSMSRKRATSECWANAATWWRYNRIVPAE
jgi:tetratricopeptide (TPR) repeat protein